MTVIASELKEELMSRGIWGDFVRRREDVKSSQGLLAAKANVVVMQEFADAGRVPAEFVERIRSRGRPKKAADASPRISESPAPAASRVSSRGAVVPFGSMDAVIGLYGISKADFSGKDCSFTVAFGWACDNLLVRDVEPKDAPSAKAWTMLVMMRYSQTYLSDLMKSGVGTLLRKAEGEDAGAQRFDGEEPYDLACAIAGEVGT